jgi:hypothetical protein
MITEPEQMKIVIVQTRKAIAKIAEGIERMPLPELLDITSELQNISDFIHSDGEYSRTGGCDVVR